MRKLYDYLKNYNTFFYSEDGYNDAETLYLRVSIDTPLWTGYPETIPRIYPDELVFEVDKLVSVAPFRGAIDMTYEFEEDKETGSGIVRMTCTYKCGEDFPYPDDTYDMEYTIRCFKDTSRYDVTEPCKIDITPKNLKKFIDEDQSRYIGDDKYYVVDLYKLGKLNAWQRKRLCQLMLDVNKGERYPYSSTLYYTDKNEWGIWDYMKAKPIKMLRE